MSVRALRRPRLLQVGDVPLVGAGPAAFLQHFSFGFLLPAPLLLPQQLLGLQQDSSVHSCPAAAAALVAVPGALVAGVPGVVFGRLEDVSRWVRLVPGVLGDGAGILPGLSDGGRGKQGNDCESSIRCKGALRYRGRQTKIIPTGEEAGARKG